jgi:DNA-binding transcriptional LysR family regulator
MLKNATLRQLATLHTVARWGSVSRAASELSLTQPAVSIQLKLLEESAGTPLLQRHGRGIALTEAGHRMAHYAGRILDLWRDAGDEMAAHRGVSSGTLRIAAVTTAEYLLPPLLVRFVDSHPGVQVNLAIGNRLEVVRQLANHEVDLVIMGRPPRELRTEARVFAKHPMAFFGGAGHVLAQKRRVSLRSVADTHLIVRERGSGTRAALEYLFKDAGLPLRVGSELSSNEAIKQMCAAGFGITFLSLHTCGLEIQAGILKLLKVPGFPIEREWFVMHLAERELPQVSADFEEFLVNQGPALIRDQLRNLPR